ncbi:hypothetical protein K2173_021100 [Erythroxylum novogranatense]|uniref:Dicer-like protein 4 n=1 Tax=Erythroxylum novogranatense TaxID=1862640 RepID=A0AAV8TMK9_9ROSI|nr:hypothetical protein K2173_021100 [Erythroxylum novogranatense]
MPDGEVSFEGIVVSAVDTNTSATVSSSITDDGELSGLEVQSSGKDPRKIARKYQLDLCKKALEENIIVYLETGCGKTHIAVLLIYELGHLIRIPQRRVCVFLAPTNALVHQQAKVIEESTDFKVGVHCGRSNQLKSHSDWEKEIEQHEVLVMTPQVLLSNLSHSFVKMDFIALLIFDECHHAQTRSNHPYAQIMKVFYKDKDINLPRIFGMTASPVVGKGASNQGNLPKSINSLENMLDAKVYSVEHKEELEKYVASPTIKVYPYGTAEHDGNSPFTVYRSKLGDIKQRCISEIGNKVDDYQIIRIQRKALRRMHSNMITCLEKLGLWGAIQACQILSSGDDSERNAFMEEGGTPCNRYLAQAAEVLSADCTKDGVAFDLSHAEVLKEPFFSTKLLRLIGILSTFRVQPKMKCIIFVNRIVTARSLTYVLQNLKFLASWKCDFLVGIHSVLKSMSRRTMNNILENFQTGKLNLLVATKVGEEGLDIQTCCLVIRFDLPETVASFIQSRGRARMPQSEYAFLVDSGIQGELNLIESFRRQEFRMNMEISARTSEEKFDSLEERVYRVDASGACVTAGYSISLLHQYCSKLPHDEYFDPKPKFFYFDDLGGTVCHIVLPSNAPILQVVGTPQISIEAAKKEACLKAVQELHELGVLSDFLLPEQEDIDESKAVSFPESSEDEDLRGELHEMLVPAVLKASWTNLENSIHLNAYYIEFLPIPEDRIYKKFGLFVKSPLPEEAERLKLDLHLARGRSVETKFVALGLYAFSEDEILWAQTFQEMFLKVILDRSKFSQESVLLGENLCYKSSPTFYLLLPIIKHEGQNKMMVDWEILRRCLLSPVFRSPTESRDKEISLPEGHLQLANGCRSICDIENSLVYAAAYKQKFFFITNIVREKNGYSPYKGSSSLSHLEHVINTFGIHLQHPEQPLAQAKPLFSLRNLLRNRRLEDSESQELDEYFIELPLELCELKIMGFSKDIGSSISLLPSIMHRLENLLVAIELKCLLTASFPEATAVTANRILEALTTEKCLERLSLERLETLGDSFLKFAVSRYLFLQYDTFDEGELTRKRSNAVNNANLFKLARQKNLEVYIRDMPFDPSQFFALGRPCPIICTKESEGSIHAQHGCHTAGQPNATEVRCSKGHHWLYKKTIADVVEALVGAFIVDSGFKAAVAFLRWIGIKVDYENDQVMKACLASSSYISLTPSMDVVALENMLGHPFVHRGLLLQAFVHPSYGKHGGGCYQRLEFLGDAVLDYLITSYLFSVYTKLKPGHLTDLRSALVNNRAFANIAIAQSFHEFLICDSSSLSDAIRKYVEFVKTPEAERHLLEGPKCPKVLGDLVESCLGAILLETGFDLNCIWKMMLSFFDSILDFSDLQLNPVRELQELCQSRNWDLQFPTQKKGRTFMAEAKVSSSDVCVSASASNSNRKEAIRTAAEQVFVKLKDEGYTLKSDYLEEILRSSCKMEPKLIGYDENPVNVTVAAAEPEKLKVEEHFGSNSATGNETLKVKENCCSKFGPNINEVNPCSIPGSKPTPSMPDLVGEQLSDSISTGSQITGSSHRGTARSRLFEVCAANCWNPPSFECCSEEGPGHLKSFTYKVLVEIEAVTSFLLECFGSPSTKKKAAAEHAAEGALWYLEHEGYLL